ncbi:MAG: glycosyltransferase [Cytophagales bacterium]|nr:MAG: glycosyltransferase [Cytophagales bacterium]
MRILFLGETYRADAITWIKGIEFVSGIKIETAEIPSSPSRSGRILKALGFFLKLLSLRKKNKFDLVLAERATSYGLFSLFVKAKVRIVAQQGITDAYPESGFSGFYKRRIQNGVYRRVDLIHAWGPVMLEAILKSGTSPSKILIRPKGIDLDLFQFREPYLSRNPTAIVTRSLGDVYRHEIILKAIALIKDRGKNLSCTIIGDGPLKEDLIKLSKRLGIQDRIGFLGRIPNNELPKYLNNSEIYISMPNTEGVSSSLSEAKACGCLPVVSDIRGNRPYIQSGKNGILVPVDRIDGLADALEYVLNYYENFTHQVRENRLWIERNADLTVNMSFFYQKYLQVLQEKGFN